MNSLREDIISIIKRVWQGDDGYWRECDDGFEGYELDIEDVVDDIMVAVTEHDGEVLEVFGGA